MEISWKKVTGFVIQLLSIWGFFYQFNFFPWVADFEWWYIPHVVTAAVLFGHLFSFGNKLDN